MKLTLLAVIVTSLTSAKPLESELKKPYQSLSGNVRDFIGTVTEVPLTENTDYVDDRIKPPILNFLDGIQAYSYYYMQEIGSVAGYAGEHMLDYLNTKKKCHLAEIKNFTSFTFTNCGSTGSEGPSFKQCISEYRKAIKCHRAFNGHVEGFYYDELTNTASPIPTFAITENGYQEWTVATTGIYNITASGAMGGFTGDFCAGISFYAPTCKGSRPDKGSTVSFEAKLEKGDTYYIAVGQRGINGEYGGGGGGGTFMMKKPSHTSVYSDVEESDVLVVAAGGDGSPCDPENRGETHCDGVTRAMGGGIRNLKGGKQTGKKCQTVGGFGGGASQVSTESSDWWCARAESWTSVDDEVDSSFKSDGSYVKHELTLNNYILKTNDNEGHGSVSIKLVN